MFPKSRLAPMRRHLPKRCIVREAKAADPRHMPRAVWRLVAQLRRLERRGEAVRGAGLNLRWYSVFSCWIEVWNKVPPQWQAVLIREEEELRQMRVPHHAAPAPDGVTAARARLVDLLAARCRGIARLVDCEEADAAVVARLAALVQRERELLLAHDWRLRVQRALGVRREADAGAVFRRLGVLAMAERRATAVEHLCALVALLEDEETGALRAQGLTEALRAARAYVTSLAALGEIRSAGPRCTGQPSPCSKSSDEPTKLRGRLGTRGDTVTLTIEDIGETR